MKLGEDFLELDSVSSTQTLASDLLRSPSPPSVVFAHDQFAGRGRFDRAWLSRRGQSLTMSLLFTEYANHPKPWLIGMAASVAAAEAIGCQVRWPNDLVFSGLKLGGVLTELLPDANERRVPVVGIGVNVAQETFESPLHETASSLWLSFGRAITPLEVAHDIVDRIRTMPEPDSWEAVRKRWMVRDCTAGKRYRLLDGREGVAVEVGSAGELICEIDGRREIVMAADALL